MRWSLAATWLVLLMGSSAFADILFDLDPNVGDLLSAEITEAPAVPPGEPPSLWEERAALGWDWTVVSLRPLPAGTFDTSRLAVAAYSSLPTKIRAEYSYENGSGAWSGPPTAVLTGELIDIALQLNSLDIMHVVFLSPQPGENSLTIDTLRVTGVAHIVPEPHTVGGVIAALAAFGLRWLIARRAKCRLCMDQSRLF